MAIATEVETVGQRIARLRSMLGMTQRELGDAGSSYAYISRIEAGTRRPSWRALASIAGRLNKRLAFALSEDNVTGLYLLTGDEHADCPFCGRSDV